MKFYKMLYIQATKAQHIEEAHIRAHLADAVEVLQVDPPKFDLLGTLSELEYQLEQVEK